MVKVSRIFQLSTIFAEQTQKKGRRAIQKSVCYEVESLCHVCLGFKTVCHLGR